MSSFADYQSAYTDNSDTVVTVNGQRFSFNVNLVDLEAASLILGAVSSTLGEQSQIALREWTHALEGGSVEWGDPVVQLTMQAQNQMVEINETWRYLVTGLNGMNDKLRASAEAYSAAESTNKGLTGGGTQALLMLYAFKVSQGKAPNQSSQPWLYGLVGGLGRPLSGPVRHIDLSLKSIPAADGDRQRIGSTTWNFGLLNTMGGSARDPSTPPSSIRVDKIRRKDGTYTVVATVPGTETVVDLKGISTNDVRGVADGLKKSTGPNDSLDPRQLPETEQVIIKALQAAGVTEKDHLVMNGHSQGAVHVLALGANPAFRQKYNLKGINTAGGPVGDFRIPSTVSVVNVKNVDDPVPALGGQDMPVSDNQLNVTTGRLPGISSKPSALEIGAHHMEKYADTAPLVDQAIARAQNSGGQAGESARNHAAYEEETFGSDKLDPTAPIESFLASPVIDPGPPVDKSYKGR